MSMVSNGSVPNSTRQDIVMNTLTNSGASPLAKVPIWFWAAAAFGLIWNVYGV